jgi:hypothetical protein
MALVTLVASVPALAQMAKPPVAGLIAARVGQDDAGQAPARIIQFVNEQAITETFIQAPSLGGVGGGSEDMTQWLKVEFQFSVNPPHPDKYPWVDSAEFKVWIEARDLYAANAPPNSTDGVAVCLTGSVTYINLKQTRTAYGVVYVHPATVARYSGSGTTEDFDRKFNVHVEAYVGGKLVDYYDKHKDSDKWWTLPTAVPDLVFRQDLTPFLVSDVTRYPQLKPLPSGSSGGQ